MVKTNSLIGFLLLAVAFNANAHDSDRIAQLEKEIQEIKSRLSRLETLPSNQGKAQEPVTSSDGWRSLTNWRRLATNMSESDVRRTLGEPDRIDGGNIAHWLYENNGRVTFMSGKVYQWSEPKK